MAVQLPIQQGSASSQWLQIREWLLALFRIGRMKGPKAPNLCFVSQVPGWCLDVPGKIVRRIDSGKEKAWVAVNVNGTFKKATSALTTCLICPQFIQIKCMPHSLLNIFANKVQTSNNPPKQKQTNGWFTNNILIISTGKLMLK